MVKPKLKVVKLVLKAVPPKVYFVCSGSYCDNGLVLDSFGAELAKILIFLKNTSLDIYHDVLIFMIALIFLDK